MSYFMIAAAVITVAAGAMEAKNQREAGKANARIAENNARLSEEAGKDAAILSARESQQSTWRTRALLGRQRAAAAAAGVDADFGSAADLMDETALLGGADRSALAQDAARKAWGFGAEALNYRNAGAQAKWQGKAQSQVTILRSLGQAAGYGSSAYSSAGTA